LPNEKLVITGDLVVHPSPYESGMFSPEWLETSKKLDQLDFRYLIPGHGNVQTDHNYLRFLNALFEEIIMQVRAAYADLSQYGLDENFVPSAIQTAYRKIIQGKQ
jgi:glyoxylase-like metal-dependent hydrolase (beta-lactamase superfamily II)